MEKVKGIRSPEERMSMMQDTAQAVIEWW